MSRAQIRVLLVDDASMICQSLNLAFEADGTISLARYAPSGEAAAELFGHVQADVLLLDLLMPDMDGFEIARLARRADPTLRILFFSALNTPAYIERARALGAAGWVVKDSIQDLIAAIKQAADGAPFISPPQDLHRIYLPSIEAPVIPTQGKEALTEREIQVLGLIGKALEVKEIADRLNISPRTVEVHRAHIFQKLHTRSIATLTKYAIAHGYTPP